MHMKLFTPLRRAAIWFVALSLGLGFTSPVTAGPGALDPSFDSGGIVVTDFNGSIDGAAFAVAVQPDGKVLAAGYVFSSAATNYDFALARYLPDGSLDPSFGTNGKVATDFHGSTDVARAVALQPDGRIVVAGYALRLDGPAFDFALARYNADGSLDASFGVGGKVATDFAGAGGSEQAHALALQPDGKIVAAGWTSSAGASTHELTFLDFAMARYNPDGSLDASFANGGRAELSFFNNADVDFISGVALQPDGKIVVAGVTTTATRDFALARYDADGRLDLTFGVNGKVVTDVDNAHNNAFAVALQPDGRIVIAGQVQPLDRSSSNFALARYLNPEVITVAIDIKPGTAQNTINLGSGGNVPVAILSSDRFDATAVDPRSVRLAGAGVALKGDGAPAAFTDDVNGDGRLDLVVHVETEALQLSGSDTQAVLTADTFDGRAIAGTDSVRIVR